MEGIISTDRWGGPLPVMLRLLKSDIEIVLIANRPFAQVVPVYRPHFDYRLLDQFTVGDFADVPPERWQSYAEWAARVTGPHRPGEYTAAERRRWAGKT